MKEDLKLQGHLKVIPCLPAQHQCFSTFQNAPGNNAVLEGASGILGNILNWGHSAAHPNRSLGFNFLLGMGQHSCSGNPSAELPEHPTAEPLLSTPVFR